MFGSFANVKKKVVLASTTFAKETREEQDELKLRKNRR
jgi:hypothetical protein